MARTNRYIRSGRPYELCLRVRQGLPFACWELIKLIFESALARTQRDNKVITCSYVLMGNHLHIIIVVRDAEQAKRFYTELQKKLTDAFKRLLGLDELTMWEGRPMVAEILDVDEAVERISYLYANPAKANLVDSIEQYPGVSTWWEFTASDDIHSCASREIPWVRLPHIPKLPSNELTERQDRFITGKLKKAAKSKHILDITPNAWMSCFRMTSAKEVRAINQRIVARTKQMEQEHRDKRAKNGKRCIGAARLRLQAISWNHKPKKKERKIFVLSSLASLRVAYIKFYKSITEKAREAYQAALMGLQAVWPPGTFRPPMPPLANEIAKIAFWI